MRAIAEQARSLVFEAMAVGWSGPPFDPFQLADFLGIPVVPTGDVSDARTIPRQAGRVQIEFNPNRSRARVRYSIAHELAHTLFPDCHRRVRNRLKREHLDPEDWQLEMLCNIGAAELLMPVGSFPTLTEEHLSIDRLMALREEFSVSSEAILLRIVRLTNIPCLAFAASRDEARAPHRYRVGYARSSRCWQVDVPSGVLLPEDSVVTECTGIGFTAHGGEAWPATDVSLHVECVGIPPYPGRRYPRVVGVAHPRHLGSARVFGLKQVRGDATRPRGKGPQVLLHVVNDKALSWGGGGFASALRRRIPSVHEEFSAWASSKRDLRLGNVHWAVSGTDLVVASMVAQHGYGPSSRPRIRYDSLRRCLATVGAYARENRASVHMPRIGTGQARGDWSIVRELVEDYIVDLGVKVTVYDLPTPAAPITTDSTQPALPFGSPARSNLE